MRRLTYSVISIIATAGWATAGWELSGCASDTMDASATSPTMQPGAMMPARPAQPQMGATGASMAPPAGMVGPAAMPANGSAMTPTTMSPAAPPAPGTDMMPSAAPAAPTNLIDPGTKPWEPVPMDQVAEKCKMDPAMLASVSKRGPLAVVRYGLLCYESTTTDASAEIWSVTKTLGAVATGMAMYQTRDIPESGPKTGPLGQFDRVDKWLDSFSFNREALVAHVLAMEAQNNNLDTGLAMMYDTVGSVQINRLSDVVSAAIAQDSERLGSNIEEFFQKFIVQKLGLENSSWSGGGTPKTYAYTWNTTLRDMLRIGLLQLNGGLWQGERLLSPNYIYNMGHVSFEAGSNLYGYLTWMGGDPCAPVPVHRKYPHGASSAADCGTGCEQKYDVGAFSARGMGGQFIDIHRGLDLVVVGKTWGEGNIQGPWGAVRPALVALDPMFKGDEAAFCAAYSKGDYAPDLNMWEGEDPVMGGLDSPPIK
jgi:CubicO group peptidase (beta-lactamase class C family)